MTGSSLRTAWRQLIWTAALAVAVLGMPRSAHAVQACRVGDFVWADLNGNGTQDMDEPGIANVRLTISPATLDGVDETTTDAGGHYYFEGVQCDATYTITVDLSTGARRVHPNGDSWRWPRRHGDGRQRRQQQPRGC